MEYVFGTSDNIETLKIKGETHTDLTGFQEVIRKFQNQTITDRFRVVRKLDSKDDEAGNCYDWYIIDRHYRMVDRSAQMEQANAVNAANVDYLSMMIGIDLPQGGENNEPEL